MQVGAVVSHYRVTGKLGQGGMGVLYAAEDTRLGREVALKHIRRPQSADRDSRERFVIEARVTGRLEHPGIVPV